MRALIAGKTGRRVMLPATVFVLVLAIVVAADAVRTPAPDGRPQPQQPQPSPPPAAQSDGHLLVSSSDLAALPTSGPAWDALLTQADDTSRPNLSRQESDNDIQTLAKALVFARTGEPTYRDKVVRNLERAIGTEKDGRTLALARNLPGYVIAADLIDLKTFRPDFDRQRFRPWLERAISRTLKDDRSLIQMQGEQGNNWGSHAAAALTAVYAYLGDRAGLERTARIVQGFLGDTDAWYGWQYEQDLDWACGPRPPPLNPATCAAGGRPTGGVLQQDQVRGCSVSWPPCQENYAWEALQGLTVAAELLHRQGYDAWNWGDRALLRAVRWLHDDASFPATGDDSWIPWLVNLRYGTQFPAATPTQPGKNFGFADWLYGR